LVGKSILRTLLIMCNRMLENFNQGR